MSDQNRNQGTHRIRWPKLPILTAACLFTSLSLPAQTWDGGGTNDNWTTVTNWIGDAAPLNNGTANIVFADTNRLTPNVDAAWSINSLTFTNGAGGFVLSGSPLTIGAGGITNRSAFTQTISNALVMSAAQVWLTTNFGMFIRGPVTNSGHNLTFVRSNASIALRRRINRSGQ